MIIQIVLEPKLNKGDRKSTGKHKLLSSLQATKKCASLIILFYVSLCYLSFCFLIVQLKNLNKQTLHLYNILIILLESLTYHLDNRIMALSLQDHMRMRGGM